MLGTCSGSDEPALPIHPTLRCMGGQGWHSKIVGGFFIALFKVHSGAIFVSLVCRCSLAFRIAAVGPMRTREARSQVMYMGLVSNSGGFFIALPGLELSCRQLISCHVVHAHQALAQHPVVIRCNLFCNPLCFHTRFCKPPF